MFSEVRVAIKPAKPIIGAPHIPRCKAASESGVVEGPNVLAETMPRAANVMAQ